MKIKFNLYFTTSKLLGYLIFIAGVIYAFVFKDAEVFIFTASLAAGLLGLKTWNETRIKQAQINNPTTPEDYKGI